MSSLTGPRTVIIQTTDIVGTPGDTGPTGPRGPSAFRALIWSDDTVPDSISASTTATEVGVKFTVSTRGYVTGVRFYRGTANNGTHTGNLWRASGALLQTADFADETMGWQEVTFPTPQLVVPGTTYIASYYAPEGHWALTGAGLLSAAIVNGPLTALQDGTDGGNGCFKAGGASAFPSDTDGNGDNYWVDVVLAPSLPGPQVCQAQPFAATDTVVTGDGKAYFFVGAVDGLRLIGVTAAVITASSSGAPTVQLARFHSGTYHDMLTTKITIDANELSTATAATPAVIDEDYDDVVYGDLVRFDVDVAGTGTQGLIIELTFG